MIPSFIDTLFPEGISYGATGGPKFKTNVFMSSSGFEQRSVLWRDSRAEYNVSQGIRDKSDMDTLLKFFYNMRGKATGFRFKDWADYQLVNEPIALGDGVRVTFPVIKTYTTAGNNFIRDIFKINVVTPVVVKVNTVVTAATINYNLGTITFPSAPGAGAAITITGDFDIPVRFDIDKMDITHDAYLTESWNSIPLVELKLTR